ncbi:MAG: hypothetical protein K5694_03880 [Bacilli bacterium]|nr:hypothetical protein [Bacilli bacterium]
MNEQEELISHILDLHSQCEKYNCLTSSYFMSYSEQCFVENELKIKGICQGKLDSSGIVPLFYGGREEAERKIIYFLPDYLDVSSIKTSQEEITCLHVYPKNKKFSSPYTHRDILGSLMGLGIKRNRIGDIFVEGDESYVYLIKETLPLIKEHFSKVGRLDIKFEEIDPQSCPLKTKFREIRINIASERLDSILSEVYGLSRNDAKDIIEAGLVYGDNQTLNKADYMPNAGQRISVQHYGKFIYLGVSGESRKGRLFANVKIFS